MVNLEYLRTISNNNQEFIKQMIESFLDQTPVYLAEMESACAHSDWSEAALCAHNVKPSATYMGIDGLLDCILKLETQVRDSYPNIQHIMPLLKEIRGLCESAYPLLKKELV